MGPATRLPGDRTEREGGCIACVQGDHNVLHTS